jgi:hypothetical protein
MSLEERHKLDSCYKKTKNKKIEAFVVVFGKLEGFDL